MKKILLLSILMIVLNFIALQLYTQTEIKDILISGFITKSLNVFIFITFSYLILRSYDIILSYKFNKSFLEDKRAASIYYSSRFIATLLALAIIIM